MQRHLLVLDGLRGVAAIAVVFFHFGGRLPDFAPMQHGYLAVDFFFVLSGFVIAYAYEARLRQAMGLLDFLAARAIRLMPLLILSLCLGAVLEIGRPNAGPFGAHMRDVGVAFLFGSALIPLPVPLSLEPVIFPLNSVLWSLFFEVVINLVYAASVRYLSTARLCAVVGLSVPLLVATAVHYDGLDCGSGFGNWWGGGARVLFSFATGVLLYRLRGEAALAAVSAPAPILAAIILAVFAVPHLPLTLEPIYDLVAVIAVFPLVVLMGSNAKAAVFAPLCRAGGDLSYPLYLLHYRLVSVVTFQIKALGLGMVGQAFVSTIATVLIVVFAYAALRFYDKPVRKVLGHMRSEPIAHSGWWRTVMNALSVPAFRKPR